MKCPPLFCKSFVKIALQSCKFDYFHLCCFLVIQHFYCLVASVSTRKQRINKKEEGKTIHPES